MFIVFFSLDSQFRSLDTLYTKPYTRVGGYFAGVWTGFYLSKINRQWSIRKVSDTFLVASSNYFFRSGRLVPLLQVLSLFATDHTQQLTRCINRSCYLHDLHSTVSSDGELLGFLSLPSFRENPLVAANLFHDN